MPKERAALIKRVYTLPMSVLATGAKRAGVIKARRVPAILVKHISALPEKRGGCCQKEAGREPVVVAEGVVVAVNRPMHPNDILYQQRE